MKLGLDLHGVADKNPFFRDLCQSIIHAEGQVFILTGKHIDQSLFDELDAIGFQAGIHYTKLFSISDYHRELGTKMWGTPENPFMADEDWDRTKGDFCRREKIDLHIDDTERYEKHFTTPFALYKSHTIRTLSLTEAAQIVKDQQTDIEKQREDFVEQQLEGEKAEVIMEFENEGGSI